MKYLGKRQQEKAASIVVNSLNEHLALGLPEPELTLTGNWTSHVTWEDSPVGEVLFMVSMSRLGLFFHIKLKDPDRFTKPIGFYNSHSGKYNRHVHRQQFGNFQAFTEVACIEAVQHAQSITEYTQEETTWDRK